MNTVNYNSIIIEIIRKILLKSLLWMFIILFPTSYARIFAQKKVESGLDPDTKTSVLQNHKVAPDLGKSFMLNYAPRDYGWHPQNWAVVQDTNGLIYIGNNRSILQFDGINWKPIPLPGISTIRALEFDTDGILHIGANNEFGYILADSSGSFNYHSLLNTFNEEEPQFGEIRRIVSTSHGMYFFGYQKVFCYDKLNNKSWLAKTNFRYGFAVNDHIFVRQNEIGLMQLSDDSLSLIQGGEFFANKDIRFMLPNQQDEVVVGTRNNALYLIRGLFDETQEMVIIPFSTAATEYFKQYHLYHGIVLSNGDYALATDFGGVVIIDQSGNLKQLYTKKTGLKNETVNFLAEDREHNLWIALNVGIAMVEINSAITNFDEESGLTGMNISLTSYKGKLYAGTMHGIFYLDVSTTLNSEKEPHYKFRQLKSVTNSCLEMKVIHGELIALTTNAMYKIDGENIKKIDAIEVGSKILLSQPDTNYLFVGASKGIKLYKKESGSWNPVGFIEGIQSDSRDVVQDDFGNLWTGSPERGLLLLRYAGNPINTTPDIIQIDSSFGLPFVEGINLQKIKKGIFVALENNIYSCTIISGDPKDIVFKIDSIFPFADDKGSRITYNKLVEVEEGELWVNRGSTISKFRKENGIFNEMEMPFRRLPPSSYYAFMVDTENEKVWFGGSEGLFCYSINKLHNNNQLPNILFRNIAFGKDSVVYNGIGELFDDSFVFDSRFNSLQIDYALINYESIENNEYSYFLKGLNNEWSEWSNEPRTYFSYLPPGVYSFKVKGRDIYGLESRDITFKFEIKPPWYKSVWAYIAYIVLFLIIFFIIVKLNSFRLRSLNTRLESIIKERTDEIRKQKEEIESQRDQVIEQKEQIEHFYDIAVKRKNIVQAQKEEIDDSIMYAKRIQTALLPTSMYNESLFGEHFVLFRPHSVVSGDFYWSTKTESWIVLAVADCTGHGVPGAFMSMLGVSFLNEIVTKKEVTNAARVLDYLRESVVEALHQTGDVGTQKDGMDISIVAIHKDRNRAMWAGANNPLWIIPSDPTWSPTSGRDFNMTEGLDGVVIEIKGDTMPVAVHIKMEAFTNHELDINKGDQLYLFTDGYPDQFGGEKGKKFKYKPFKKLLVENSNKPMSEQKVALENTLDAWMNHDGNKYEQIDDITVVGVKV